MNRVLLLASGLLVAAVGLGLASSARAHEDEWSDGYYPHAREGLYVGLGGLFALENFDRDAAIEGADTNLKIGADNAGGFELRGGYRLHPNFAGELLFQYYGGFSVNKRSDDESNKEDDHFNGWSLTLNAKGYPLLGRIQPYALGGFGTLGFPEKRGPDFGFVARLGGGVDFYLSEALVLAVEAAYVLPAGSIDDYQFATFGVGIQYRY